MPAPAALGSASRKHAAGRVLPHSHPNLTLYLCRRPHSASCSAGCSTRRTACWTSARPAGTTTLARSARACARWRSAWPTWRSSRLTALARWPRAWSSWRRGAPCAPAGAPLRARRTRMRPRHARTRAAPPGAGLPDRGPQLRLLAEPALTLPYTAGLPDHGA